MWLRIYRALFYVDVNQHPSYAQSMKKSTAVKKAKSAYKLAALLGVTRQAVSKWGAQVPPARVEQLRELRPEWFAVRSEKPTA